ncbi:ATP-binding cassette domain-containing protein [Nesterenkonia pannonica]|uniref:ATP-binding cassette domain-containing protein n=1 Tax=Nesterenkonia pannonica TaxID=1548602 RepID=UPI002164ABC0|nr:ATP-binding cassette domain-containing protein [Nesterenkonia pannonica]
MSAVMVQEDQDSLLALRAHDIHKHFDGVAALSGARLDVREGEIHALLGENGAGKSTLIKVLTGVHQPDQGSLERDAEPLEIRTVRDAQRAGVVALYQETSIIPTISVAENILLGERTPAQEGL